MIARSEHCWVRSEPVFSPFRSTLPYIWFPYYAGPLSATALPSLLKIIFWPIHSKISCVFAQCCSSYPIFSSIASPVNQGGSPLIHMPSFWIYLWLSTSTQLLFKPKITNCTLMAASTVKQSNVLTTWWLLEELWFLSFCWHKTMLIQL